MAYTKLRQSRNINASTVFDDSLSSGVGLETSASLESDLNSLRSQINKILGSSNWYDAPSKSLNQITTDGITIENHKSLRQLVHLVDGDGPFEGFASGAFQEILPTATLFPETIIWWESAAKLKKIVQKNITWTDVLFTQLQYIVFDIDGVTPLATITDNINYEGVFETTRTRTIS